MRDEDANGIPKILYWLMGAMLLVTMTGASWTAASIAARLTAVELSVKTTSETAAYQKGQIEALKDGLVRIEGKLDEALNNQRSSTP